MLETPMLFTDDLVRCIVEGIKTETRRYAGAKGSADTPRRERIPDDTPSRVKLVHGVRGVQWTDSTGKLWRSPYGGPGDLIWVRESFATADVRGERGKRRTPTGWPTQSKPGVRESWIRRYGLYLSETNCPSLVNSSVRSGSLVRMNKLFMPRWASRIELRITSTRFERLDVIDEAGAIAEGFESRKGFEDYWCTLYGSPSGFPYVWVYRFEPIKIKPVRVGDGYVNSYYKAYRQ